MTEPFPNYLDPEPSTPAAYGPSETALLLLDFHVGIIKRFPGDTALSAVHITAQLRHWARAYGIIVIHASVDAAQSPAPTTKGAERLSSVVADMVASGGVAEPAELVERYDEQDLTFTRAPGVVSALKSPGLMDCLESRGIKSLVLCGLSTSGAVLRTAMPATDAGFVVTVVRDGCADPDREVHEMVMGKLLPARAWVVTHDQWRKGYEGFHAC